MKVDLFLARAIQRFLDRVAGFALLFRNEDPLDVPIGLEDVHELSGGRLPSPRRRSR